MKRQLPFAVLLQQVAVCLLIAQKSFSESVEIQKGELGAGKIYTACSIEGEVQKCLFDSGSPFTTLKSTPQLALYPSIAEVQQAGSTGSAPQNCDWIELKSFAAADLKLKETLVVRCPENLLGNVVGINFFQAKTLHLSFSKLKLMALSTSVPRDLKPVSFLSSPVGHILLSVTINERQKVHAVWDTGAGLSVVDKTLIEESPENYTFVKQISIPDANHQLHSMNVYTMASLTVGGKNFRDLKVLSFDFKPIQFGIGNSTRMILGFNVISQMDWYFDLRSRLWATR